jgi:hypothetical protein
MSIETIRSVCGVLILRRLGRNRSHSDCIVCGDGSPIGTLARRGLEFVPGPAADCHRLVLTEETTLRSRADLRMEAPLRCGGNDPDTGRAAIK